MQTLFFRRPWQIVGENKLGIAPVHNPGGGGLVDMVPLPRLFNQQLDMFVESRMLTIEKDLLIELQSHILNRNSYDWFGIYLVIYTYLAGLELDSWNLATWEHNDAVLRMHERVRDIVCDRP